MPISPALLTWPGDPGVEITPISRLSKGDSANVSELRVGSHTGTHIDPPYHFLDEGRTVDEIPLDVLVGDCFVGDLTAVSGPIGPADLEAVVAMLEVSAEALPITRLLLKTRNSALWGASGAGTGGKPVFPQNYVSVSLEGAQWMVDQGIGLVGIDFLSIEASGSAGSSAESEHGTESTSGKKNHPVHRTLLEAGIVILEGVDLSQVEAGQYELVCLPLRIAGGDGSPARAVLVESRQPSALSP